jgi:hypothetical protein
VKLESFSAALSSSQLMCRTGTGLLRNGMAELLAILRNMLRLTGTQVRTESI